MKKILAHAGEKVIRNYWLLRIAWEINRREAYDRKHMIHDARLNDLIMAYCRRYSENPAEWGYEEARHVRP